MPVIDTIQIRRGTAAAWTSTNPTLAAGEIGWESDTGKLKIGDGSTAWTSLAYDPVTTGTGSTVLATSPTLVTPALGTPSSGVLTNCSGTAASLTAGHVTTNANLTGPITSSGNATSIASQTGTGSKFVMDTSSTINTSLTVAGALTSGIDMPLHVTSSATYIGIFVDNTSGGQANFYVGKSGAVCFQFGCDFDANGTKDFFLYDQTNTAARIYVAPGGNVGIGSVSPTSKLQVVGLPVYANNAAAITGGLTAGAFYRTGGDPDPVCVVH